MIPDLEKLLEAGEVKWVFLFGENASPEIKSWLIKARDALQLIESGKRIWWCEQYQIGKLERYDHCTPEFIEAIEKIGIGYDEDHSKCGWRILTDTPSDRWEDWKAEQELRAEAAWRNSQ